MLVVGYFTGSSGLVAISNASMLCFIINSIGIGLSIGGSVVAAEAYGKGARTEINKIIISQFFIMMWISIPISLGTWLFNREIFLFMDIPAEALSSAGKYMDITAIGVFFSFTTVIAIIIEQMINHFSLNFFWGVSIYGKKF